MADTSIYNRLMVADPMSAAKGFDVATDIRNNLLQRDATEQTMTARQQGIDKRDFGMGVKKDAIEAFRMKHQLTNNDIDGLKLSLASRIKAEQAAGGDVSEELSLMNKIENGDLEGAGMQLDSVLGAFDKFFGGGGAGGSLQKRVQSTEDLGGGAVRVVYNDGSFEIKTPDETQSIAIQKAQQQQLDFEKQKSTYRAGGTIKGKEEELELTASQRAEREAKKAAAKEQAVQEVKTSNIADQEKEKKLGNIRATITGDIKLGAQQARRSKSNLLRLQRALRAIKTGRVQVAKDLLGNVIPGVKDASQEEFIALASQYTLDELSRQSGTKTDFDFKKAEETQARLGNTVEANEAIVNIAFDRLDELEHEERQFKQFVKDGGKEEDFEYAAVPIEHIQFLRENADDDKIKKDFKAKYGYLPSGL